MKNYQPGSLVKVRNRDWVVMPSDDEDLLRIKPLGGSEDEETGIKTAYIYLDSFDDDVLPVLQQYPDQIQIEYFS